MRFAFRCPRISGNPASEERLWCDHCAQWVYDLTVLPELDTEQWLQQHPGACVRAPVDREGNILRRIPRQVAVPSAAIAVASDPCRVDLPVGDDPQVLPVVEECTIELVEGLEVTEEIEEIEAPDASPDPYRDERDDLGLPGFCPLLPPEEIIGWHGGVEGGAGGGIEGGVVAGIPAAQGVPVPPLPEVRIEHVEVGGLERGPRKATRQLRREQRQLDKQLRHQESAQQRLQRRAPPEEASPEPPRKRRGLLRRLFGKRKLSQDDPDR